jgi:hypothetical protein
MRKTVCILLLLTCLFSWTMPAFAAPDYRTQALDCLSQKYGNEVQIDLYEGETLKLEFSKESFWFAKYSVMLDKPAAEPVPPAAPDSRAGTEPGNQVLPQPPTENYSYIYGGVYIRLQTGEIFELEDMERFFAAESKMAEKEWERLRQEAGKVQVYLYRHLQTLPADEKVRIVIIPVINKTDEIIRSLEALKQSYPDFAWHIEAYSSPDEVYGFSTFGGVQVTDDEPENSVRSDEITDDTKIGVAPDADSSTNDYWQRYSTFYDELNAIMVEAAADSLVTIKSTLDGFGIWYKPHQEGFSLTTELTAAQIIELALLPEVASIQSEEIVTMDGIEALWRQGAQTAPSGPTEKDLAADNAAGRKSFSYLWLLGALVPVAALAAMRRRKSVN